jgi:hypothetical protein
VEDHFDVVARVEAAVEGHANAKVHDIPVRKVAVDEHRDELRRQALGHQ